MVFDWILGFVGVFMNTTFVPKILYKLLLLRFEVDFELVSQLRM